MDELFFHGHQLLSELEGLQRVNVAPALATFPWTPALVKRPTPDVLFAAGSNISVPPRLEASGQCQQISSTWRPQATLEKVLSRVEELEEAHWRAPGTPLR